MREFRTNKLRNIHQIIIQKRGVRMSINIDSRPSTVKTKRRNNFILKSGFWYGVTVLLFVLAFGMYLLQQELGASSQVVYLEPSTVDFGREEPPKPPRWFTVLAVVFTGGGISSLILAFMLSKVSRSIITQMKYAPLSGTIDHLQKIPQYRTVYAILAEDIQSGVPPEKLLLRAIKYLTEQGYSSESARLFAQQTLVQGHGYNNQNL